ncbi:Mis12-domain-containing protein [Marasmius fiardii PR-910]|nr:Mis12-domain-containing protein [Marasmius fiardii PR-910]
MSRPSTVPPLLITEALGFSPQLLLDDIINIANAAVTDGVNGLEGFLQQWVEKRSAGKDYNNQEIEQGLVAFQTLLEHHTDLAFDFFEAWCLRNIFAIPPDLPIVLPHQENLDLTIKPAREEELMEEVASLRSQIDNQRRLHLLLSRALRVAKKKRLQAEKRLDKLSIIDSERLDILAKLPQQLMAMNGAVTNLPVLDPATIAALTQFPLSEPGKREWETSKTGYLNWAVSQLLERSREEEPGSTSVDRITRNVEEVGKADQLREAFEITESLSFGLEGVSRAMEHSEMEE